MEKRVLLEENKREEPVLVKRPITEENEKGSLEEFVEWAYSDLINTTEHKLVFHVLTWHVGDRVWPLLFDAKELSIPYPEMESCVKGLAHHFGWALRLTPKTMCIEMAFTKAFLENGEEGEIFDCSRTPIFSPEKFDPSVEETRLFGQFLQFDGPNYICGPSLDRRVRLAVLVMRLCSTTIIHLNNVNVKHQDVVVIPNVTMEELEKVVEKEISSQYDFEVRKSEKFGWLSILCDEDY